MFNVATRHNLYYGKSKLQSINCSNSKQYKWKSITQMRVDQKRLDSVVLDESKTFRSDEY